LRRAGEKVKDLDADRLKQIDTQALEGRKFLLTGFWHRLHSSSMRVLAFDVYGTLVDIHGIRDAAEPFLGAKSSSLLVRWREKTVEYAFRRGLMQNYVEFGECSRQALEYANAELKAGLTDQAKQGLLDAQHRLPAFSDVVAALPLLSNQKNYCVAFSNGTRAAVEKILRFANLIGFFADIISVDEVRTFKPSPAVYSFLLRRVAREARSVWLISSNGWDVIGIEPDLIVQDLTECSRSFDEFDAGGLARTH
jgi:2-haloacid dehalogenase